jgi:hypothetical protein
VEEIPVKYAFIVLTNAVPGREDEFNRWYTDTHLSDVLRLPGIVAAQRYKLAPKQRREGPYPYHYAAIYDIETENLDETISALKTKSGTSDMPISDAMHTDRLALIYEPITKRIVAKL